MCRAVTCKTCGKTTWAGCGKHVDQVMRNVAVENRCSCPRDDEPGSGATGSGSAFSRWRARGRAGSRQGA